MDQSAPFCHTRVPFVVLPTDPRQAPKTRNKPLSRTRTDVSLCFGLSDGSTLKDVYSIQMNWVYIHTCTAFALCIGFCPIQYRLNRCKVLKFGSDTADLRILYYHYFLVAIALYVVCILPSSKLK